MITERDVINYWVHASKRQRTDLMKKIREYSNAEWQEERTKQKLIGMDVTAGILKCPGYKADVMGHYGEQFVKFENDGISVRIIPNWRWSSINIKFNGIPEYDKKFLVLNRNPQDIAQAITHYISKTIPLVKVSQVVNA